MFKRFFYPMVFVFSGNALAVEGFNDLKNSSEGFVRSTCSGFVANGANNAFEAGLFDACGTMVHSVNALSEGQDEGGSGPTAKDRALSIEELAGGFQNIAPEETLAPISIAANTSSLGLSAINSRLEKNRFGSGAGDELFSSSRLGFFINGMGALVKQIRPIFKMLVIFIVWG